jgi:predicted Fe-Mo cluster-binding NifX family protein
MDPRFGRARQFLLVDSDTREFRAVANPNIDAMGGAGIQSAQLVAKEGAEIVITGSCGPNAYEALSAAGIQVFTGASGTVRQALDDHKSGKLRATSGPDVPSHSGTGSGSNPGSANPGGMGRGRGMGMGRGMGRGKGLGLGPRLGRGKFSGEGGPTDYVRERDREIPREQEMRYLKEQSEILKREMEAIEARIREIEERGTDE